MAGWLPSHLSLLFNELEVTEQSQHELWRCGFKDIFKGGKGAFCTTYTWLTVLRGPRKHSYVPNCLRSVYNKDEQSCLHSFLRSSWIYFLRISGEPAYKLWKIWTKSSSFQLCRKDSRWVCLILSNGSCFRAVSRLPWNISSPYKYFLNQLNLLLCRECAKNIYTAIVINCIDSCLLVA